MSGEPISPDRDLIGSSFFGLVLAAVKDPSCTCNSCQWLRKIGDQIIAKMKEA